MNFSKEPIVWIGAIVVILQTLQAYLQGGDIDIAMINNLFIVVGSLVGRQLVSPVEKPPVEDEDFYA